MNPYSCRCMEKSTPSDMEWADVLDHVQNHNEAFHHHSGCSECNCKPPPHHSYPSQNPPTEENTNAHERRSSNNVKSENHEIAKVIPRDRTMMNTTTSPVCYSGRESDSIHQAYAQKFAQNNHKNESTYDHSKMSGPNNSSTSANKGYKPESQFCHHQSCSQPNVPTCTSSPALFCGSTSDKTHSNTCGCQKALTVKSSLTPPLVAAVNVVRPPCPYCGSRIAKCMGCGYNTYGQAYPPPYSSILDPGLQFNCCSSVPRSQPIPPLSPTFLEEACEKRLNACIKDVSKNLNWVLNSLQRFKYCPVCGNPNCNS